MPRGRPKKIIMETIVQANEVLRQAKSDSGRPIFPETEDKNLNQDTSVSIDPLSVAPIENEIATLTIDKENKTVELKEQELKDNIVNINIEKANDAKIVDIVKENLIPSKNVPPKLRKRNEYGLLEGVDYIFKDDGRVNWKAMIKPEFLVFNREKKDEIEKSYGKKLEELSVTDLADSDKDKYLLILLNGIRDLASLRGFYNIHSSVPDVSILKATVITTITWIPNYESENSSISTAGIASASLENTNGFGSKFLEAIAENRAFVRAVRNYLEINIAGKDEVAPPEKENKNNASGNESFSINNILKKTAEDLGLTFDKFKEGLIRYKDSIESDYSKWQSYGDLPPADAYRLTGILKKALEAKKNG